MSSTMRSRSRSTVKNAITGTGLEAFDFSAALGSAGSLQSVINMDRISKYPDAPSTKLFGESSTLGILAHETGHRWLARLVFRECTIARSRISCWAGSARTGASSSTPTDR